MPNERLSADELRALQAAAEQAGRECVVGGVIVNDRGEAFVQKRAPDRRLFPGSWDIVGGHLEPGETIYAALAREIQEETGWELTGIAQLVHSFDWESEADGGSVRKREFDFLVEVRGDLADPQIEWDKFTEWAWVSLAQAAAIQRDLPDQAMLDLVRQALEMRTPSAALDGR